MSGPSDTYASLWCGSFQRVCWAPRCQCCWMPGLWTRTPPRDSTWWQWLTAASPPAAQELRDITEITFHQRRLPFARSACWKLALLLACCLLLLTAWTPPTRTPTHLLIFFFLCLLGEQDVAFLVPFVELVRAKRKEREKNKKKIPC